jgi:hypothetical protein
MAATHRHNGRHCCSLRYGIEIRECKVVNGIEGRERQVKVEQQCNKQVDDLSSVGLNLEERATYDHGLFRLPDMKR